MSHPSPASTAIDIVTVNAAATLFRRWLAAVLDELDYGIVVLGESGLVVHVNHAARVAFDDGHPLHLVGGELRARHSGDMPALREALDAAGRRGLRGLLTLDRSGSRPSISVVPLDVGGERHTRAVLVVLGKRAMTETLSVEGFARSHGLTTAETHVLTLLCGGVAPVEAASRLGVAISTVRSQVGSIRAKTGTASIRALVSQVAVLPPVKGALRLAVRCAGLEAPPIESRRSA